MADPNGSVENASPDKEPTTRSSPDSEGKGRGERPRRRALAVVLLVVGLFLFAGAIPSVWMQRSLLTTDGWLTAVAPLPGQPAVRESISAEASNRVLAQVDVEQIARDNLPEDLDFATPLVLLGVRAVLGRGFDAVLASGPFRDVWVFLNQIVHHVVIQGVFVGDGVVDVHNDDVVLDVAALLQAVINAVGLDVSVEGQDMGEFFLFRSEEIGDLSDAASVLQRLAVWLPMLALFALLGSFLLWPPKRHGLIAVALGCAGVAVLLLLFTPLLRPLVLQRVPPTAWLTPAALREAYDAFLHPLRVSLRLSSMIGLIVALVAMALGPHHSAITLRSAVKRQLARLGEPSRSGPTLIWIRMHQTALQILGTALLIIIFLAIPRQTIFSFIILGILLSVYLAVLNYYAGSGDRAEREAQ